MNERQRDLALHWFRSVHALDAEEDKHSRRIATLLRAPQPSDAQEAAAAAKAAQRDSNSRAQTIVNGTRAAMLSRRVNAIPTPLAPAAEARRVAAAASAAAAAEQVAKQARRAAKAQRAAKAVTPAAGLKRESASALRPHEPKRAEALDVQSALMADDAADATPDSSSSSSGDSAMEARFKRMEQQFNARLSELEARNEQLQAVIEAHEAREEAVALGRGDSDEDEQHIDGDGDDAARTSDEEESGDERSGARAPVDIVATEAANRAPGGPQSSPTSNWARVTTMAIPPPPRPALLQYEKIETQLETWLKQYQVWFRAAHVDDESDRVAQALATVDATVQRWWETRAEAKQADSWTAFEAALRATFIRQDDAARAAAKIRELRMTAGEDYHQYFLRVEDLRMRANIGDDDKLMLGIAFERFDQARWPIASAQTAGDIRTGRITTFSALRIALANRVLDEPKLQRPSAAQPVPSSKARLNSAATRNEEGSGETDGDIRAQLEAVQRQLSALQSGSGQGGRGAPKRCGRCGDKTHWAAECKAPDNRECFKCHKKGHIARDCKEGEKEGGAQQPLNREARQ